MFCVLLLCLITIKFILLLHKQISCFLRDELYFIINTTSVAMLLNFLEAEKPITFVKGKGFKVVELNFARSIKKFA